MNKLSLVACNVSKTKNVAEMNASHTNKNCHVDLTTDVQAFMGWYTEEVSRANTLPFMVDTSRSRRPLLSKSSANTML